MDHSPTTLLIAIARALLASRAVQTDARFAADVWSAWSRETEEAGRRAGVEALARMKTGEIDTASTAIANGLPSQHTPEARTRVRKFLRQVPAAVRRSLRRLSDPPGQSLPARWNLTQADDLLPLLPARSPTFDIGQRLPGIGNWELVELLEASTWGESWKATDQGSPQKPVVLQLILDPALQESLRQMGNAEIQRVQELTQQPGWVPLQEAYLTSDPPCLQWEFVEAGDICGLQRDWAGEELPVPRAQATDLVRQVAQTLAAAHALHPPLVYQGLNPGEILVSRDAAGWQCRLLRAGFAPGQAASANPWFDPVRYLSPQQQRGEPANPRDDVFALGVLWYQLLTGDLRAGRPGGSHWRRRLTEAGIAGAQVDVLESCFEDDLNYRPADAAALVAALSKPETAVTPAPVEKPDPLADLVPRSRRRASVRDLIDTIQREVKEQAKTLVNSVGIKLVLLPAGSFLMGSHQTEVARRENEGPQHEVSLPNPFYMAAHAVTQAQYLRVMNSSPSRFNLEHGGGADHPVENVTWNQAVEFCRRLSELAQEKEASRKYRLPTEAEWEYACRGGTTAPFSVGDALSAAQANFDGRFPYGGAEGGLFAEKTLPVGSFPANNFGLYDMHGNVWEWCQDWLHSESYRTSPKRNPQGPPTGRFRVLRGGSWRSHAAICRSAYRNGLSPASRDQCTGFRVVLEI
jgi:formylglycine-generating enzyme required for sulfatase activity